MLECNTGTDMFFNPLNAELNPISHLLALAGAHHFVDVSRIRVNSFIGFFTLLLIPAARL
jgi:ABC-type transporter lipoprotein component MlaA